MTLPLIHALQNAGLDYKTTHHIIISKRRVTNKSMYKKSFAFVKENDGLAYATTAMNGYYEEALSMLNDFPESSAKESLTMLLEYTINRKKYIISTL